MMSFNFLVPKEKTAQSFVQIRLHDILWKKSWEVQVQAAKAAIFPYTQRNGRNVPVMLQESLSR